MAILVDRSTRVLIQGITGREGQRVTSELLDYQVKVVAGVTPGKGGQEVDTVPVFSSVAEAIEGVGPVDVSMVYVPPLMTLDAASEAIEVLASQVFDPEDFGGELSRTAQTRRGDPLELRRPLIHIFAEKVPVLDTARILAVARAKNVRVLGPASVGAISPGEGKIGSIGGPAPDSVFAKGLVGVISRSGGMCSELGLLLTSSGFGQSTVVGVGGDLLVGTGFDDLLLEFEKDPATKVVVAFGEVGGRAEIEAANLIKEGKFTKPLIVFLAGKFAEGLPKDTALGHAGAIVGLEVTMKDKIRILKDAGAILAENFEDIPGLIKKVL